MKTPTKSQEAVIQKMLNFLAGTSPFFLTSGAAGTGKTFCVCEFAKRSKARILFTAPTNKAVSVLRNTLETADFHCEASTIYSYLGLKLEPSGSIKILKDSQKKKFPTFDLIVIDEGSMVNKKLWEIVQSAAKRQSLRFLVLGDRYQLPPVGEVESPVWGIEDQAELTEVVRHTNTILDLAEYVKSKIGALPSRVDLQESADVSNLPRGQLESFLHKRLDLLGKPDMIKLIAWRNLSVDGFNATCRRLLFPETEQIFAVGDRIMAQEPASDSEDEFLPLMNTSDEGTILKMSPSFDALYSVPIWDMSIALDKGGTVSLRVPTEAGRAYIEKRKGELAEQAKAVPRFWKDFWEFHESFHYITPAYAQTSHKSQGSTYREVLVDVKDILSNRDRETALRCLYVAITRASHHVWLIV
jgi:ATP-dependent exoDNAse (exonuclease V) alpha subunit